MKKDGKLEMSLAIEKLDAKIVSVLLPCGKKTILDKKNLKFLKIFKSWSFSGGYVRCERTIKTPYGTIQETRYLHRLITKPPIIFEVDHINRNKLDNRECNLRWATRSQNKTNSILLKKNRTSKYRGVNKHPNASKKNPWRAYVTKNKKTYHLGWFKSEKLAAIAYNEKALKIHGNFAVLNKI